MDVDLNYFDGYVALDGPNRPASRVLSGRRECTTRLPFDGLSVDSAELIASVATASAGLADARVDFGGDVVNVGAYGYAGEICDDYEVSAVTMSVTGWRELTSEERVVVKGQIAAEHAATAAEPRDGQRDGPLRRPPLGRLHR